MRVLMLAIAAQLAWMLPACAESTPETDRSLRDALPLFEKNRCADVKDPAGQLFCGDPDLLDAGARLNVAVQDRVNRMADRPMAIEENVEWIKGRSLSCGIFERQGIASQHIPSVKACLLKETEDRIAILADPNFDCLATNTTAGILICGDPELAIADRELNGHVVGLIGKMRMKRRRAHSPNMPGGHASATASAIWLTRTMCRCRNCHRRKRVWQII